MNAVENIMIDTIRKDLRNPKLEGFFLESDGNSLTVRRLNKYQFDATTESWKGHETTYYKVDSTTVLSYAEELIMMDDHCVYVPHFPATRWSEARIEKFMTNLAPSMCKPDFSGFALSAENARTFTVLRHPNGMEWYVDGNATDFVGVLRKTRKKLAEEAMWEYKEI